MSYDDNYVFDNAAINNARIFTIVIASISTLFPLSVVVILIQRYNELVREKPLIHYVMMIAIADTITSLTIAFGFPGPGPLCTAQGFLNFFFSRMSWFFTDVLIFQLFYIVVFKKHFLSVKHMHCIVWPLNIILQILPFTTGTRYGFDNDVDDGEDFFVNRLACGLGTGTGTFNTYLKWSQYVFNIELIISFFIIIVLSIAVVFYSLNMKSTKTSHVNFAQRIRESWSVVILYPCAMILAWLPGTIYAYYGNYQIDTGMKVPYHDLVILNYLNAINALYGPLLALIFYTKTLDARRAWISNFRQWLHLTVDSKADVEAIGDVGRRTCTSIISVHELEITTSTASITSINPISSDITRIDGL